MSEVYVCCLPFDRFGGWSLEPSSVSGNTSTPAARVWFNNKGYHAIPSYFNALSNNLLRTAVDPAEASNYGELFAALGVVEVSAASLHSAKLFNGHNNGYLSSAYPAAQSAEQA